jgi:ATP-dependent Clp protease ATP-binding subunit ClpA
MVNYTIWDDPFNLNENEKNSFDNDLFKETNLNNSDTDEDNEIEEFYYTDSDENLDLENIEKFDIEEKNDEVIEFIDEPYKNNVYREKNNSIDEDSIENNGPILADYSTDLTALAKKGQIEECFGRDRELLEMMEILVRRQKNNPVLVGDPGVGKTAIIELFATKLVKNLVPFVLQKRRIVSLDLSKILAGAKYRGQFESRFKKILDEILSEPNIILFIDEIHTIAGAGAVEGSLDAANILKPMLSRSGFLCVGATTVKEYQQIEKDPALNRRFQPIKVDEPSIDDTITMLFGLRPSFEAFHNVFITPSAIEAAVELSKRYIYDRFLPDKAIDLIDRASAKEVIKSTNILEGSVVSSIVNAGIINLGKLRLEAFRRGDIPTEFIFQEIENAYRNFLIRWIENPTDIKEKPSKILSPISNTLFDKMKFTILARVDDLLFASNKTSKQKKKIQLLSNLSSKKNNKILSKYYKKSKIKPFYINLYRLSLIIFDTFDNYVENICENDFFGKDVDSTLALGILAYPNEILKKNFLALKLFLKNICIITNYKIKKDFFLEDIEIYEEYSESLSKLEKIKLLTFKTFIKSFRPLLKRGIINSLKKSSQLKFSKSELNTIYNLLGYFSSSTGHNFLSNLNDPKLIKLSRKTGDFSKLKKIITEDKIKTLLSSITGVPMQSLSEKESRKLANLEKILHKRIIGQKDAVRAIAKAIRRSRLGIQNPNRPIASFFFCGPTGVGKTEVTKALASTMFGSEKNMIRFDMSEFMEKFSISRLIGSPPGYIGYEEGGQLTEAVRRKPYAVILFDEVEKAHPDVLNILLQILDDGRLTDSQKRLILFENTVIIMTSNAGASEILNILRKKGKISKSKKAQLYQQNINNIEETKKQNSSLNDPISGTIEFLKSPIKITYRADLRKAIEKEFKKSFYNFEKYKLEKINNTENYNSINKKKIQASDELDDETKTQLKTAVLEKLSTIFLPEFLNRIDDIIIFEPLKPFDLLKISKIMINNLSQRLKTKKIELSVNEAVKVKLAYESYNPIFGARPLRRTITKYIEDSISQWLLTRNKKLSKKMKKIKFVLNESDEITLIEEM